MNRGGNEGHNNAVIDIADMTVAQLERKKITDSLRLHPNETDEQLSLRLNDEFVQEMKELLPPAAFDFAVVHEWDLTKDRTQAVYSCHLEDLSMIEEGQALEWIRYAISWAEYVQDFGDYETREEFHHGTEEEWEFEMNKSRQWIRILREWGESLNCSTCPDDTTICFCFEPNGEVIL